MSELGLVTEALKAKNLLRWAIEWIEYAGAVPYEGTDGIDSPEEPHHAKYVEALELLK